MRRLSGFRIAVVLLSLMVLGAALRRLRLMAFEQRQASLRYEDIYYLPPPDWLPVLSLGYQAAWADLIWCRFMVYFGEELVQRGVVRYVFDYTDAILRLDPDFRSAYEWIATAALYRPNGASLDDGLRATRYLKRALERWPHDGQLHWKYGSILRFELAPLLPEGPRKDKLIAEAAPHLAIAASLGAGPKWLALNSAGLFERLGKTEQAIRHLEEVYGTVQDEMTKRAIEKRLSELRSASFVEALKTANAEFEARRRESYPYLSPGLFLLVGEPVGGDYAKHVAERFMPPVPAFSAPESDEPAAQAP